MFTKTMKFDDLDGNEVQETFYFNYNKKEIAELLEFGVIVAYADPNKEYLGLEEQLKKLTTPVEESGLSNRENNLQAYEIFQNLLLDAYGVKNANNVAFDKTPELRHYWSTHVAFPEMVFEFLENTQLAAEFIEKCLPPRLVKATKDEMQKENAGKLSSQSLADMVEEAAKRQQDPATRIEPGPEAAAEALGSDEITAKLAQSVKDGGDRPAIAIEDLTEEDILNMDQVTFDKLSVQKLSREQMMWAFRRKSQS